MKKSFSEIYWLQQDVEYLSKEQEAEAVAAKDWDRLVRSMIPLVLKLAREVCSRWRYHDIDTVISEGFIALNSSVRRFDPSYSRLTTWCYKPIRWACMRVITNPLRRKTLVFEKAFSQLPEDTTLDEKWVPSGVMAVDDRDMYDKVLELLTPKQKNVVNLRGQGLTYDEIAESMGVTRQYCQQVHGAAKARVREAVEKHGFIGL